MAASSPANESDDPTRDEAPDAQPTQQEPTKQSSAKKQRTKQATPLRSRLTTRQGWSDLRQQTPGWLTSLFLHALILFLLGYVTLPLSTPPELSLQAAQTVEEKFELEEDLLDVEIDLEQDSLDESINEQIEVEPQIEVAAEAFDTSDVTPLEMLSDEVDFGASITELGELSTPAGLTSSGLSGRSAANKANLLRSGGGTRSSEKAVRAGLDWLARHQYPDGSWNFDHTGSECNGECADPGSRYLKARSAATGLALLCYMGAGHTQEDGQYQRVVTRGIYALGNMFKLDKNGVSFWDSEGRMYSHGIATMAICEAYALTGKAALREPAQAAINYTCYAQDPNGGGWRYTPQQPGDTSVVGWQIGALKSGYLSQLSVPPLVIQRASGFLDSMMNDDGSRYFYDTGRNDGHEACTAIGALCRMYMGTKKEEPGIKNAIEYLSKRGPSKSDVYYNYYTAQALFHYTGGKGPMWKKWNDKMRNQLVEMQATTGHEAGSWAPTGGKASHDRLAGRVFTTALSTMTLEVYYRMMPIYREKAVAGKFEFE